MSNIKKESLLESVQKGIITQEQYQKILALDSGETSKGEKKRGLNYIIAFYYFGAMIIIFAFTYFLVSQWENLSAGSILAIGLGFQIACAGLGVYIYKKLNYPISGGLLVTAAIAISPLVVYSIEKMLGIWPASPGTYGANYSDYWRLIKPCWVYIELVTLIVAFIALYFVRFSFIALAIGHTVWFLSMDLVEIILGGRNYGAPYWETRQWVSVLIGATMVAIARLFNRRTKEDYSLWLFLYGGLIFTTAASFTWLKNEMQALLYLLVHLIFVVMSIRWQRKSLMVFGALGIYVYLGHLAYDIFKNSPFFPIALALIGLLMILGTVSFQRNQDKLVKFIGKV